MINIEDKITLNISEWNAVKKKVAARFGKEPDLQAILFLIGHRELGAFRTKFTKEQKLDLMHVATATLLTQAGYFQLIGLDKAEWPHFEPVASMPPLRPEQQEIILKNEVINYFKIHNI